MVHEKMIPPRERVLEDMQTHGMGVKTQKAHIREIARFAGLLKAVSDTAMPDDLRACQLHNKSRR